LCLTSLSTGCDHIKHNGDAPPKEDNLYSMHHKFHSPVRNLTTQHISKAFAENAHARASVCNRH